MTNEERRRTMEFILEQQAQMAAHLQQLEEERIRDQPRLASVERSFQRLDDLFDRVVKLAEIVDYRLDRLESNTTAHEIRTATHEANMAAIDRNMAAHEIRTAAHEANMAAIDRNMAAHEIRTAAHEANMAAIERNMAALAEVQARTDEKLGALIDVVRQDRNRPRN